MVNQRGIAGEKRALGDMEKLKAKTQLLSHPGPFRALRQFQWGHNG